MHLSLYNNNNFEKDVLENEINFICYLEFCPYNENKLKSFRALNWDDDKNQKNKKYKFPNALFPF